MRTIIKYSFVLILFFAALNLKAQDSQSSDTKRKWYLPDHAVAQFAGNIGLVSAGFGYSYFGDEVQTDLLYGFVPPFEANTSIHILTAKTSYHPYNIHLGEKYLFEPLRIGTGISYSAGSQFYTSLPKRYPDRYYWWASSLRITPFIGTAISKKVGNNSTAIKRVQFYGELGTTDLDIVSKFGNKSLPLWDILNIAFGTKLVF